MTASSSVRFDISFRSGTQQCRGWLYRPAKTEPPPPVIVMAHGLGGVKSASQLALRTALPLLWRGVMDAATAPWRAQPLTAATAVRPATVAFMTGPDSLDGYLALTQHAPAFRNRISARFALHLPFFMPGRSARRLRCPSYFALCATDSVAPAAASDRHARRSSLAEVKLYPCGHFDVYVGDAFEVVAHDYVAFLQRHVPVIETA